MDTFFSALPPPPPGFDDDVDDDDDNQQIPQGSAPRSKWWRMRLQNAHDQTEFPQVLSLAQEITKLDAEDTELSQSKTYRSSLNSRDTKLAAIVLHHLDGDARDCLIRGDYAGLKNNPSLPPQLTEVIDDNPISYRNKDATKAFPKRPIMYMHFHVDQNDQPPSLEEYLAIKPYIQSYINVASAVLSKKRSKIRTVDQNRVNAVDLAVLAPVVPYRPEVKAKQATATTPAVQHVPARPAATSRVPYVVTQDPRYGQSANLILGLTQFLAALGDLDNITPHASRSQPIEHAVSETGWTGYPNRRRFEQAEHGASTNKIMALIDAAARHVYPRRNFRMRWLIVLEVVRADIAGPGEKTLSRLAASYTTAGGVNGTLAGLSVTAAEGLTNKDYTRVCNERAQLMMPSVYEDKAMVEERIKKTEQLSNILEKYRVLDALHHLGIEKLEKLDVLDEQYEGMQKQLQELTPPWNERVYRESLGIKEQQRLSELAKKLKGLI